MYTVDDIKNCKTEDQFIEKLSFMSDDVPKKCYSYDQAEEIVAYLGCYNLLDISYVCREQILYTIAEFVNNYKIVDKCLFNKLKEIQLQLEDDLKEYVDEIVSL